MNRPIIIATAILIIVVVFGALAYFLIVNRPAQTEIYISPQTVQRGVGQTFSVEVDVSDVTNLYGYELTLGWNTTILELENATEGTFLRQGENQTFFTYVVNASSGLVKVDCTLLGDLQGISGKGTLASVQFQVKANGSCDLALSDTQLVKQNEDVISHIVVDGHFTSE